MYFIFPKAISIESKIKCRIMIDKLPRLIYIAENFWA